MIIVKKNSHRFDIIKIELHNNQKYYANLFQRFKNAKINFLNIYLVCTDNMESLERANPLAFHDGDVPQPRQQQHYERALH